MPEKQKRTPCCIGLLAHVDAGKTTLSEAMLYLAGSIRKLGRVDHRDTFLDTFSQERARGITIFSKQARMVRDGVEITLLDTPGHADFSAEAERTLQVLDCAVLVVSGADGVQSHTRTLWKLLEHYRVPVFLFVNKMDQAGTDREKLMAELKAQFGDSCVDFGDSRDEDSHDGDSRDEDGRDKDSHDGDSRDEDGRDKDSHGGDSRDEGGRDKDSRGEERRMEEIAMCGEDLLDEYIQSGNIGTSRIAKAIQTRKLFPCYFGSALKLVGVEELMDGICRYGAGAAGGDSFGARVYKIARDGQGNRLTFLKVTGGTLRVKMPVAGRTDKAGEQDAWEEKISQIRLYSGEKYETTEAAEAGTVCAVCGLSFTYPGQGLGSEAEENLFLSDPVLSYRVCLPEGCDAQTAFAKLRRLGEEEPQLHMTWDGKLGEIHVRMMGEMQAEILKSLISERYGMAVEFDEGSILYKETIAAPVEGVGHYEPLRHYAEVHLLLEPGEPGSGLQFGTVCDEEALEKNWQRLILSHLEEREYPGVLTGAPITDMKITLLTGRAHQKHTEGGDFRQATVRAIRQGLKTAECILLEPWYRFRLEVPRGQLGRAMNDIRSMSGEFSAPETVDGMAVLTGKVPAGEIRNYQTQLASYTAGQGRLSCALNGYEPCHNADEVIAARGYGSEADLDNPSGSVFCAHGAGFTVSWDQVRDYMHVDSGWKREDAPGSPSESRSGDEDRLSADGAEQAAWKENGTQIYRGASWGSSAEEKELEAIFARTYGPVKRERSVASGPVVREYTVPAQDRPVKKEMRTEYLLVDGYNVIFSWDELRELARVNLDGARGKLMDILSNYQGIRQCVVILVFDAYRVKGGTEQVLTYHNIHVVYTREAETADQYIEKATHRIDRRHQVTVASSDGVEQIIILGQGAARMSARELREEIERACAGMRKDFLEKPSAGKNLLIHHADDEMKEIMEDVRLGKRSL